jgi:hypothetical protein
MATVTGRALRLLQNEFRRIVEAMEEMHPACEVRPSDPTSVLRPAANADGTVTMHASPVVCRLPERAQHRTPNLYVVFEGSIRIGSAGGSADLVTHEYATNFGYFVFRHDRLLHALGGHYDYDADKPAHPRAHMQLSSQLALRNSAGDHFPSIADTPVDDDLMTRVLHRVRTPTAQMDFLSFMLQIAADHLAGDQSLPAAEPKFRALCQSCAPLKGFNAAVPLSPCGCQRGTHWYPT